MLLGCGLGLLEVGARTYDYGTVAGALASFVRTEPSRFGSIGRRADWLVTDPDLGYRLNPEAETVNSLGIRGPEVSMPKPPGRYRIVVMGDSVAWPKGGFVPLLGDQLQAPAGTTVEMINAGIPGYTTYQERVLLERDMLALEPDLVLVQYCLNDNHRFLHYVDPAGQWLVTEEAMHWLASDGDGMLARLTRTSSLVRQIRFALSEPVMAAPNVFQAPHNPHFGPAWQDGPWEATETHLASMRDAAHAHGAQFAIVMPPIREQLVPVWLELDETYTLAPQRRMKAFAKRENIRLLDLHPRLRGEEPDGIFYDPLHFTDRGHEITARELRTFLRQSGLGPEA